MPIFKATRSHIPCDSTLNAHRNKNPESGTAFLYGGENCNCSTSKRTNGEHFYNENGNTVNQRNVATYSPNRTRSHGFFFPSPVFGELLNNPLKVTFVVSAYEGLNCHIPGCHKARPCNWSPQFQKNLPPPVNAYREVLFFLTNSDHPQCCYNREHRRLWTTNITASGPKFLSYYHVTLTVGSESNIPVFLADTYQTHSYKSEARTGINNQCQHICTSSLVQLFRFSGNALHCSLAFPHQSLPTHSTAPFRIFTKARRCPHLQAHGIRNFYNYFWFLLYSEFIQSQIKMDQNNVDISRNHHGLFTFRNIQALKQLSLYRMQSVLQENVHSVNLKLFCPRSSRLCSYYDYHHQHNHHYPKEGTA